MHGMLAYTFLHYIGCKMFVNVMLKMHVNNIHFILYMYTIMYM